MKNLPDDLSTMDDAHDAPTPATPDEGELRLPPSRISASTLEAARAVDRHYAERRAERGDPGGAHDD